MSILNFNSRSLTSQAISGLPAWMIDGDLLAGRVPSSCKMRQAAPGMPLMNIQVHPEFMHCVNDLFSGNAVYGSNTKSTMAEDTINGIEYVCAYSNKIYAMTNGAALKGKNELPLRMIFLLAMPYYMRDAEFSQAMDRLKNATDDVDKKSWMAIMFDNLHERYIQDEVSTTFEANAILRMTPTKCKDPKYMPAEQEGRQFKAFQNIGSNSSVTTTGPILAVGSAIDPKSFNGKFAVCELADLTDEGRQHIVTIGDEIVLNEQHLDVCSTIQQTLGGKHPFCNYLFRGQPGGGKSTFVKVVAAGLRLPYYSDVLRDDLSGDFFSGYYAPDCDKKKGTEKLVGLDEYLASLPDGEAMHFDPISSYEALTGTVKDDATEFDCKIAEANKIQEFMANLKGESRNALTFVEGLIPKLDSPCLIFYDEVTAPKNPGAITALNTIMDRQRVFTLSTGRVVHRHPLSVMCFAGNFSEDGVDLEGARDPNRTWQDRNNEIFNVRPPRAAEIKAQLIADTGYDPTANANIEIDQFVSILPELQKVSSEFYGVCGYRALSNWLAKSMISGSPIRAAETTIINGSTNDINCAGELRMKIQNHFRF